MEESKDIEVTNQDVESVVPTVVYKEDLDRVLSAITLTNNEHYKNELSLQATVSNLEVKLLELKSNNRYLEDSLHYVCGLPWYKRLFRKFYDRCLLDAELNTVKLYSTEIDKAKEVYETNVASLKQFIESTPLPENN